MSTALLHQGQCPFAIPVAGRPASLFLEDQALPLCVRVVSSEWGDAGHRTVLGVWRGFGAGPRMTLTLTFVLSSGSTALDTVSEGTMLWFWGVRVGWSPSLLKLASPAFLPAETPGAPSKLPIPCPLPAQAERISPLVWRISALHSVWCSDTVVKRAV